jgi:hypothetical protein
MEPSMQPNLPCHGARRCPAWGVAVTASIAVASALLTIVAQPEAAVAINSPPLDRPLPHAENARSDDADGRPGALVERIAVAVFAHGPLTLHL